MNEFIELRKKFYKANNPYIFPLALLDEYIKNSKTISIKENDLINKIQRLKKTGLKSSLEEKDLDELLSFLGEEKYLDRYIVDLILKESSSYTKKALNSGLYRVNKEGKFNNRKLYHLMDICIESNIKILNEDEICRLLEDNKTNFNLLAILLDYIANFSMINLKKELYSLLEGRCPRELKLQILDLLVKFYGIEKLDTEFLKEIFKSERDKNLYENYMDFIQRRFENKKEGIQVLQSMFYGDFEDSGKGNNGGLAIFLKSLGNQVSKDTKVSRIVTLSISRNLDKPFISYYGDKHIFLRLPIYIDKKAQDPFIEKELFIKRYIKRFLKESNMDVDIFHIRYLDNASRAVSLLSKDLNKKLVLTLTPDPHRNMFDHLGKLKNFEFQELIGKLNKIKIGDELIYRSDGILGIGSESLKEELAIYFPQLKSEEINKKLRMISEGIQYSLPDNQEKTRKLMDERFSMGKIDRNFFKKPIILNVGRLDSLKGQIELLKAWGSSSLYKTYNLLIIGGDLENPSEGEKKIINFFEDYIKANPHLNKNFYHMGAIPNEKIRILESDIMKNKYAYPHIYLCSSKKEEFGIAILEALSQGFLVMGPVKGGVRSYITNGKNGFLIDTNSYESISKETEDIIYNSNLSDEDFRKIQKEAKKTINDFFSIEKISQDFLDFYLSVKGEGQYEV